MFSSNIRSTPQKSSQEVNVFYFYHQKRPFNNNNDQDFYRLKNQDLEAENQLLLNESILANQRARDAIISDNKMDSFIKENSSLVLENEKLLKLAKQKKTESELWKSKYESQM